MAIDLLAGTKRQDDYSRALLASLLSGRPAYSGGEAAAKALTAGLLGAIEKRDQADNFEKMGGLIAALRPDSGVPTPSMASLSAQPSPAMPSPRLPAIGSPQDNQALPDNPNGRVAAVFGGMNPQQRDVATRTVLGEAANQGPVGMQGVADVMKNRADVGGFRTGSTGPTTMDRVALAPGQFEPHMTAQGRARMAGYSPSSPAYQTAQAAVDNASIGGTPDVTGGATHFYSPSVNAQLASVDGRKAVPDWAAGRQPTATIGTHQFFNPAGKPPQAVAQAGEAALPTNAQPTQGTMPRQSDPITSRLENIYRDTGRPMREREAAGQMLMRKYLETKKYEYKEGPGGNMYRFDPTGVEPPRIAISSDVDAEAQKAGAIEKAKEQAKRDVAAPAQKETAERYGRIVTQDIDRILTKVTEKGSGLPITGPIGGAASYVPGTDAFNVGQLLDTVKANASFQRLQEMRAASPTGGALGSVTEKELSLLQSSIGALGQSQNKDQFVDNLRRVKNIYLDIINGPGNGPRETLSFEKKRGGDGGWSIKRVD